LSPFELKDELISYAKDCSSEKSATHKFLDAGRGNPNWLAIPPRQAFFLLGEFALRESRRVWAGPRIGGMPHADGIAKRLLTFLDGHPTTPAVELMRHGLPWVVDSLNVDPDAFVHELIDGVLGDNYPEPDRMLPHAELIVRRFLNHELLGDSTLAGRLDLFAVEGGTAAICYVFRSLFANGILERGDTIAVGTPIFAPYLELAMLEEYQLEVVQIEQNELRPNGQHSWQYPERELDKLLDPRVKAFFIVHPSNPASFGMSTHSREHLQQIVQTKRPDLIILSDDVYATFVPGFRSLADTLPQNTLLMYSFSKYFGCTGWRLGVIALAEDNVIDRMLRGRSLERQRYRSLTDEPEKLRFIDRMVADSRDVALNHTAGLSTPQQVQMTLFALASLLDEDEDYRATCRGIIHTRLSRLQKGLGVELPYDPLRAGYYLTLDLAAWGVSIAGPAFLDYVAAHHEPFEIVVNLARKHGSVLLNGNGFEGPPWSVRISLANLDAEDCETLGRDLAELCRNALAVWQELK
jgi:aspartate 4-decarboxylase